MIYFVMLALGVAVESIVLFFGLQKPFWVTGFYSLLINGITHPLAWWMMNSRHVNLWLIEIAVVLVETWLIWLAFKCIARRALLWSTIANSTSAAAGIVLARAL